MPGHLKPELDPRQPKHNLQSTPLQGRHSEQEQQPTRYPVLSQLITETVSDELKGVVAPHEQRRRFAQMEAHHKQRPELLQTSQKPGSLVTTKRKIRDGVPPLESLAARSRTVGSHEAIRQPPPAHSRPKAVPADNASKSDYSTTVASPDQHDEEPIDLPSRKGFYGWTSVDGVNFPFLLRESTKFVSVRMVEQKLLSKYPSTYPVELKDRPPLMSQYITESEAKLLNEVNLQHCEGQFGKREFTTEDLVVSLCDFEEFYGVVKKFFPNTKVHASSAGIQGGWVQVNNTVVPYLMRKTVKLVPLSVIRFGAGLLTDKEFKGLESCRSECAYLTKSCKTVGLDFSFSEDKTRFMELRHLPTLSKKPVKVADLPCHDPFGHAEYSEDGTAEQDSPPKPTSLSPSVNALNHEPGHCTPPSLEPYQPPPSIPRLPQGYMPIAPRPGLPLSVPISSFWQGQQLPMLPSYPAACGQVLSMVPSQQGSTQHPVQRKAQPRRKRATKARQSTESPVNLSSGASSNASSPLTVGAQQPGSTDQSAAILAHNGSYPRTQVLSSHRSANGVSPTSAHAHAAKPTIMPVDVHNRTLSCLFRESEEKYYALVEAISRVYFPGWSMKEFLRILKVELKIQLHDITRDEEEAFISFYSLPTRTLNCGKMMSVDDLTTSMLRLKHMSNERGRRAEHVNGAGNMPTDKHVSHERDHIPQAGNAADDLPTDKDKPAQSGQNQKAAGAAQGHTEHSMSFTEESASRENGVSLGTKRPLDLAAADHPRAKMGRKSANKLEAALNRIKQFQGHHNAH